MSMKMSMVLPEDSLFRKDCLNVLDLLYRNYKAYVESGDPTTTVLLPFEQSDLDYCKLSLSRFLGVLIVLDKAKVISLIYDIDKLSSGGNTDPVLCNVIMQQDFGDKHDLLLYKLKADVENKSNQKLITKDEFGCYSYNDQPIAMGINTIYYNIFDALFLHHDQDGNLSYKDIEGYLTKSGMESAGSEEKRNKRINNAIVQLFRSAKVGSRPLKNTTPRGEKLVVINRGRGLRLNNPMV